jgi:hypothetical protein
MDINYKTYIANKAVHSAMDHLIKDKDTNVKIDGRTWTVESKSKKYEEAFIVTNAEASLGQKLVNAVGLFFKYVFDKSFRGDYKQAKDTLSSLQGRATLSEEREVFGARNLTAVKNLQQTAAKAEIKNRVSDFIEAQGKLQTKKNLLEVELRTADPARKQDLEREIGELEAQLKQMEKKIQDLGGEIPASEIEKPEPGIEMPSEARVEKPVVEKNKQDPAQTKEELTKLIDHRRGELDALETELRDFKGAAFDPAKDDLHGAISAKETEIRKLQNAIDRLDGEKPLFE